jgi:hypothetical protein
LIFERTCFPSFQATGKENAKHSHHRDDSHGRGYMADRQPDKGRYTTEEKRRRDLKTL